MSSTRHTHRSSRPSEGRKRKCDWYRSAEKGRKQYSEENFKKDPAEFPELKYTVTKHERYTCFEPSQPKSRSESTKSWGDLMEEEDRLAEIRERRRSSPARSFKPSQPKRRSESTKSWGDLMEEEDRLAEIRERRQSSPARSREYRKKLPLHEIDRNCSSNTRKYHSIKRKAIEVPLETDERKITARQRQIDIGKETEGYKAYTAEIDRIERTPDHPWTPNKFTVCSTRSWQGVMRIWRRKLHFWDPAHLVQQRKESFLDISASTATVDESCSLRPRNINNSMERDDYCSEYGSSQASSNEDASTKREVDELFCEDFGFDLSSY